MTLSIATSTNEGIILTADSRQTYINRIGAPRIASDNGTKVFQLGPKAGLIIAGQAFFNDGPRLKRINAYIEEFTTKYCASGMSIKELAEAANKYFTSVLLEAAKHQVSTTVTAQGGTEVAFDVFKPNELPYKYKSPSGELIQASQAIVPLMQMIVAGYDKDMVGRTYTVTPPNGITSEGNTTDSGTMWVGQGEVMSKLFTGSDPLVVNLTTMTIQDAIDFAVLMTRITENIQQFSDGTQASLGGIPGVGGSIDIAVITPDGFKWVSKKELRGETQ